MAQVAASVGFGGSGPDQTGQLLPADGLLGIEEQISEEGLRGARGKIDGAIFQTDFICSEHPDLQHKDNLPFSVPGELAGSPPPWSMLMRSEGS